MLLQLQQEKAKARQELELRNSMRQTYDNLSYENNETKQEPTDSNSIKAPTEAHRPAQEAESSDERIPL